MNYETYTTEVLEQSHKDFKTITGGETTKTAEATSLREQFVTSAESFLSDLQNAGLIHPDLTANIVLLWEKCEILDQEGMTHFTEFMNKPYIAALEDLSNIDPEGTNTEIQELANKVKQLIHLNDLTGKNGQAFVFRNIAILQTPATANLDNEEFLIVNMASCSDQEDSQTHTKVITMEESLHLISHFKQYGEKLQKKRVEETMSRVVASGLENGYNSFSEESREKVVKDMRVNEYMQLYQVLNRQIGDETTLVGMFFGKVPIASEKVTKAIQAIESIELIGQLVDAGIPLDKLKEAKQ